ncbi:monocarboxylate transporter 12-like [Mya arenaria]|uniref:monocarboxylate transporter 12-like n=1 Tax=Mya arenaria TaxID=6604 RepID=UPI0022E335FA|nr:monocarboxylate transporter 12-like [Mya arenaria]
MMYIPPLTAVGQYFQTRHALAVGIALCGSGIGTLTLASLSEYLIETYTWKGAMQILSALVLNGVPLGLLLRPIEKVNKGVANGQAVEVEESGDLHGNKSCCRKKCVRGCCCDLSSLNLDLFRSPSLMGFALMNLICSFGYFIPFVFLPAFGQSIGFTSKASAILVSVIGILNTVFRVVSGWVSDQPWANPIIIYSVATILGGAATSLVAHYTVYWVLVAYCVLYGICIGTIMTNEPIVVTMLVNKPKFASAFGIVAMGDGISAMVGAPISGALYDMFGNYRWTFLFSGMTMVLAGFIGLHITWINRLEFKRTRKLLFKRDGLEIHAP